MTSNDRLSSWKEIASYLDTTPRTVMRWESAGLPVHRLQTGKRPTIYAFKSELDAWVAERSQSPLPEDLAASPATSSRRTLWVAAAASLAAVTVLGLGALSRTTISAPANGEAIALTSDPGLERSPALSPDGAHVAYARQRPGGADFDIFVLDLRSGDSRPLAVGPNNEFAPAWSPDGKSILYVREKLETQRMLDLEVVLADADASPDELGGGGRVLTGLSRPVLYYHEAMLLGPYFAWKPDGRSVILPGGTPGELSAPGHSPQEARGLFSLDVLSGERTRLTLVEESGGDTEPTVSPDGRRLAFVRRFQPYYSELFVLDLESPHEPPRQLTHFGTWVMTPRFSGDGESILVSAGELGASRAVWSIDSEGKAEPTKVLTPPRNIYGFDISRDGETIVFTQGRLRADIWGVEPGDSPHVAEPVVTSPGLDRLPALSPDGSRMAFFSDRGEADEVWTSAAEGSGPSQLTNGAGQGADSLDWSPDGRSLVTTVRRGGERRVALIDVATGALSELTNGFEDTQARWGPQGEWIYFRSNRTHPKGSMHRIPRDGGEAEHVSPGACLDFTTDGAVALLARTNRRLFSRLEGKGLALATIAAPHAFAPAQKGVFFLNPMGPDRVSLEYATLDGSIRRSLLAIPNPGRDLTVDAGAKRLRWSRAEQAESDLMMARIE